MEDRSDIIKKEFNRFARELKSQFDMKKSEEMAKKTGFKKRESKFKAKDLILLCVFYSHEICAAALNNLCAILNSARGISMSSEALNKRFNKTAVELLKLVLTGLLKSKINSSHNKVFNHSLISKIRISDATVFQLPNKFESVYKGCGGSSNTAGVKILLEYDLLSGEFINLLHGPGNKNDKTYGEKCLEQINESELFLRDLGYFDLQNLRKIGENKAYYVSRVKLRTNIYIKNKKPEYKENGSIKKSTEYIKIDLKK